jgi:hypothetical protein
MRRKITIQKKKITKMARKRRSEKMKSLSNFSREIFAEREVMRALEKFERPVGVIDVHKLAWGLSYDQVRATLRRLAEGGFVKVVGSEYYAIHPYSYYEKKRRLWFKEQVPAISTSLKRGKLEIYGSMKRLEGIERELRLKHQVRRATLFECDSATHELQKLRDTRN